MTIHPISFVHDHALEFTLLKATTLKQFVISLRASISSIPAFKSVRIIVQVEKSCLLIVRRDDYNDESKE